MLHFPSALRTNAVNGSQKRSGNLNATQQKSGSSPLLLKIEEELHDARRVRTHGQEEDLRLALDMVITRVTELSSMLSEAYKTQADLEVQLNVAKSNLALVIANNEMLEDALRRDSTGSSRDVGWRRRNGDVSGERQSLEEWHQVVDFPTATGDNQSAVNSPQIPSQTAPQSPSTPNPQTVENNRFFKFRFASTGSRPASRPSTPSGAVTSSTQVPSQVTSPVAPPIPAHVTKELEDLNSELQKERSARQAAEKDKTNLEAEIESLSQALFEEANKMVATERIKLYETEEELKELRTEKEALKKALRIVEGENLTLREGSLRSKSAPYLLHNSIDYDHDVHPPVQQMSRSRSSSEVAIKSRPGSAILESTVPLPPSPTPEVDFHQENGSEIHDETLSPTFDTSHVSYDSQKTPKKFPPPPLPSSSQSSFSSYPSDFEHISPWVDVPSSSPKPRSPSPPSDSDGLYAAAAFAAR